MARSLGRGRVSRGDLAGLRRHPAALRLVVNYALEDTPEVVLVEFCEDRERASSVLWLLRATGLRAADAENPVGLFATALYLDSVRFAAACADTLRITASDLRRTNQLADILGDLCREGSLGLFRWVVRRFGVIRDDLFGPGCSDYFRAAVHAGRTRIAYWLLHMFGDPYPINLSAEGRQRYTTTLVSDAASGPHRGAPGVMVWLWRAALHPEDFGRPLLYTEGDFMAEFVSRRRLDALMWILTTLDQSGALEPDRLEVAMFIAGEFGVVALMRTLMRFAAARGVDLRGGIRRAFAITCDRGHLSVAQWLHPRLPAECATDTVWQLDVCVGAMCHPDVMQWLIGVFELKPEQFAAACRGGTSAFLPILYECARSGGVGRRGERVWGDVYRSDSREVREAAHWVLDFLTERKRVRRNPGRHPA